MPKYLVRVSYTAEAIDAMVKKPEDRSGPVKAAIEGAGGKLECLYGALGEFDAVAIADMPNNVTAAALSMVVSRTGRYQNYRTTPLLTLDEMVEAMRAAGKVSFRPAGG